MDRAELQALLAEGFSLAEIGRRHGLHESTVGYWAKKHGLKAAQQEKHAARGGLAREDLEALVEAGSSIAQIAEAVDRSRSTVRHWLVRYGLETQWAQRRHASASGLDDVLLECQRHGATRFRLRESGGYRCLKCRAEAVAARRRRIKQVLVQEAGGCCRICGYDGCIAALEFHHVIPAQRRFGLSESGVARSLAKAREEAAKCVLLCANCHAEVEAGARLLT